MKIIVLLVCIVSLACCKGLPDLKNTIGEKCEDNFEYEDIECEDIQPDCTLPATKERCPKYCGLCEGDDDGEGSGNSVCFEALDFMNKEGDFETPVNRIAEALDELRPILTLKDASDELDRFKDIFRKANIETYQLKSKLNAVANDSIKMIDDFEPAFDNEKHRPMIELLNCSYSTLNKAINEFKQDRFERIAGVQIAIEVIKREIPKILKKEPGQDELADDLLEIAEQTINEIYGGYRFLREEYPLILEWIVLVEQAKEEMAPRSIITTIQELPCKETILNKTMIDLGEACNNFLLHTLDSSFLEPTTMRNTNF